jgi:hypothetical protein
MLSVDKIKCACCNKRAIKRIDGMLYCAACADNVLLKTIKRCIENIEGAVVTIKIIPKGVLDRAKEKSSNGA